MISQVDIQRRGFTLIELMLVISIMLILSGLSLAGVGRSLRSAAVSSATAGIREAVSTAQDMALGAVRHADAEIPGVLIAQRNGAWAVAPILVSGGGVNNVTWNNAITDAEGVPAIIEFSPNVRVWSGDSPANYSEEFVWFYEPGSGETMIVQGSSLSPTGAMVGIAPPSLFDGAGGRLIFGAFNDSNTVAILAPPSATNPGLSLRTRDQRVKRAVSVSPIGTLEIKEFE